MLAATQFQLLRACVFRLLPAIVLLTTPLFSLSQHFDFNPDCQEAYQEIISLRFGNGQTLLDRQRQVDPGNRIPVLLENYLDFLSIVISEDEIILRSFKEKKNNRLTFLKQSNTDSPWHLHSLAEVHLHSGMANFLFREFVPGLMDLRKAYSLLEKNIRQFPHFNPSKKSYLVIQSMLAVIPEKYNWGLKLFGFSAGVNEPLAQLDYLIRLYWGKENFMRDEAALNLAMLLLHLKGNRDDAWQAIQLLNVESNLFARYIKLKIAVYAHQNEQTLALSPGLVTGDEYAEFPALDYYHGLALLQKLDISSVDYFKKFIAASRSQNLLKSAYHKIGWADLIMKDTSGYLRQMSLVRKNGTALAEADKQAQREAEDSFPPHPELVKARLLFDGGYFKMSLEMLDQIEDGSLDNARDRLELIYRQARVLDEMGDTLRAIERYMVTLSNGKEQPYYYAANAALRLAHIYEERKNYRLSKEYYIQCLRLDEHEYKNSLQQKAKAGLERVEELLKN